MHAIEEVQEMPRKALNFAGLSEGWTAHSSPPPTGALRDSTSVLVSRGVVPLTLEA